MTNYKLFHCPRCNTILYCPELQKTKLCPRCQKNIETNRQKIVKTAKSIQEAIFLVQNLALPPKIRQEIANSQKNSIKSKSKIDSFLEFINRVQQNASNQMVDEKLFYREAQQAGFSVEWVSKQLIELQSQGLLIRPSKDHLQFVL